MATETRRITQQDRIDAIIHCIGFFIDAMSGTENDKKDATALALNTYNDGASAAHAIYQGYDLIRKRHYAHQCLIAIIKSWSIAQ